MLPEQRRLFCNCENQLCSSTKLPPFFAATCISTSLQNWSRLEVWTTQIVFSHMKSVTTFAAVKETRGSFASHFCSYKSKAVIATDCAHCWTNFCSRNSGTVPAQAPMKAHSMQYWASYIHSSGRVSLTPLFLLDLLLWTLVERLFSGWALSDSQWQLYSSTLIPSTHYAPFAVCHSQIVTVLLHSAFLNIHRCGLLTALFGCCMATAVTRGWKRNQIRVSREWRKNSSRRCCREANPRPVSITSPAIYHWATPAPFQTHEPLGQW